MNRLDLLQLLPPNLAADEGVQNIVNSISSVLNTVAQHYENCLIYPRIDNLKENVIDALAWQLHVDYYDADMLLAKKKALVKQAIINHMYKGTPYAVEQVVKTVFKSAKVQENWIYGGLPYHFQVADIEEALPTDLTFTNKIVEAISKSKNVRSRLDGIVFQRNIACTIYQGGYTVQQKVINIYPAKFNIPNLNLLVKKSSLNYVHREVSING